MTACSRCNGSRRVPCFAGSMLCPECNGLGWSLESVERTVKDVVEALTQVFAEMRSFFDRLVAEVVAAMPRDVDPARGTLEGPRVFRRVDPQEQAKDGREFTRGEYHASRLRPGPLASRAAPNARSV